MIILYIIMLVCFILIAIGFSLPKEDFMKIAPVKDDHSDFDSVYLHTDNEAIKPTPHCRKHGAMNKITSDGLWRCISAPGFRKVKVGNAKGEQHVETTCQSACNEVR